MKVTRIVALVWIVMLLGSVTPWLVEAAHGQEQPVRIILKDGSSLVGVILEETDETIHFRTFSGLDMTIAKEQVARRERVEVDTMQGRLRSADPNYTRLFFAPTARSLGSGQGYVSLYEIFFPFASVGLGDVASLAGGVTLFPTSQELVYGAAKLTLFEQQNVALAAGVFAFTLTDGEASGGILMGVGTLGPSYRSLTVGLGFGFGGGKFEETPAFLVGGEIQASDHIKFITENYVIPNVKDGVAFSGGLRFFGERLAADVGLVTVLDALQESDGFPFLPWLGFTYNFGRRRL